MTSIRLLWLGLCLAWIGAEIALALNSRKSLESAAIRETRSQRLLWLGITGGVFAALVFKGLGWAPLPLPYLGRQIPAILIFAGALFIRFQAVARLGRLFTTDVAISRSHRLIVEGPYRQVRHPAYSGLLLALLAAGIAMGDFLALAGIMLPAFAAVCHRIGIEEKLLEIKFGEAYRDYKKTTWKLVPRLY